jgi:hypothetical protein
MARIVLKQARIAISKVLRERGLIPGVADDEET